MKTKEVKLSELSGAALDWAVAKCEGEELRLIKGQLETLWTENGWKPSTDWSQGGPIIERIRGLYVKHWVESSYDTRYEVHIHNSEEDCIGFGETLLIAAMRCYVASRLGDTVSVPVELLEA